MATAEFELNRRELLSFSKKHRRVNQPQRPGARRPYTPAQPPHYEGFRISKRQALTGGAIIAAGITVGILKPWERSANPEIDQYYPELKSQTLYSRGEFHTAQTTTKWLNFTRANFDPAVAQATFDFLENLAKSQRILQYKLSSQSIPFGLDKKPRNARIVFLIPENAPLPAAWGDVALDGSTTGVFNNVYTTFVRFHGSDNTIPPSLAFTTRQLAFSKVFNVEAAQSSFKVSSVDTKTANFGQEIVCNSYGSAFTIKQMEIPYNRYLAWAKDTLIRQDASSPYYPLYVLSEQEYNEIPKIGLALR